ESQLKTLPLHNFELHFHNKLKQRIHAITLNIDFHEPHHHPHTSHIFKIIHHTPLSPPVKPPTKTIFQLIPHPQPKIHAISFKNLHFHELRPIHSIIHIIPPSIALQLLNIHEL
uniref:nickel insertion protein n=1 Tax=Staphylococcus capitis TaxID=29388 RepID=UPI0011A6F60F